MVKPAPEVQVNNKISEEEVDKIINMGAPVKQDLKKKTFPKSKIEKKKKEKIEWILIPIRVTKEILQEMDKEIKPRIGISRNSWVLEAILEKLKKDASDGK